MSRNYTPAERALCLIGVMAGKSLKEINEQMDKSTPYSSYEEDKRKLNPRSYELLKTAYVVPISDYDDGHSINATVQAREALKRKQAEAMWDHCVRPKSMSELKSRKPDV